MTKKVKFKVGQIWRNPKEKQTKVLLAVCPPEKKGDQWFAAFQVLETGCVYNEHIKPEEHIYIGQSACNLAHLFETAE